MTPIEHHTGLAGALNSVTLACRDLKRMTAFYRQFGWPEPPSSVPEHAVFQCTNGLVLGLFAEPRFVDEYGPVAAGFRGFTLSIMVPDVDTVTESHRRLATFDDIADLDQEPHSSGFGCGFSFRDPEGNVWDVAHKFGAEVDRRPRPAGRGRRQPRT